MQEVDITYLIKNFVSLKDGIGIIYSSKGMNIKMSDELEKLKQYFSDKSHLFFESANSTTLFLYPLKGFYYKAGIFKNPVQKEGYIIH